VVFAYHNVGVRCLSVLLDKASRSKLVVTHEDAPGENIWFASVRAWPRNPHSRDRAGRAAHPKSFRAHRGNQPDYIFRSTTGNM